MVHIAIVEDNGNDLQQELDFLHRFEAENDAAFEVSVFGDPVTFLEDYTPKFDIIFLDIELPHLNGVETAQRLRALDEATTLIFITNMEQYAVNGYEVDARDFVVKPINYYRFSSMMKRALRGLAQNTEKELLLRSGSKVAKVRLSQIHFIEIRDHLLIYHTAQGDFDAWSKMSDVEAELSGDGFARCNTSHLVNLRHIDALAEDAVTVQGCRLPISQRRRKEFYKRAVEYFSVK